jgi:Uma2 family endonuclease
MGAEVHFLLAAGRLLGNTSNQARHDDMTATQLVTAEELYQMGSEAPYELWEGVLKEVSPSSWKPGVLAARMVGVLINYVDTHGLGYISTAESGYILNAKPYTVVAPDVAFVRKDRYSGDMGERGFYPVPPDLAVEVISPTDRKTEIVEKQTLYTRAGVPLVWWVDPERKTVTVYRLGHALEVIEANGVLDGGDVLPGFTLELQAIFRD